MTQKRKLPLYLDKIKTDIEEVGLTSTYFQIFDIKDVYGKGVHTITMRGSTHLKRGSIVRIEILDEKGYAIPINVPPLEGFEDTLLPMRRFTFEITDATFNGVGKITMVGTLKDGKTVRYNRTFAINPSLKTQTYIDREDWELTSFYNIGDVVQFGGSSYVCILSHQSSNDNIPPNVTYWRMFSSGGLSINLTSEAHVIPFTQFGLGDYTGASTAVSVFRGSENITSQSVITVASVTAGLTGSFNNNTYTVQSIPVNFNGVVEFEATVDGATLSKVYSVSSISDGMGGDIGLSLLYRGLWDSSTTYESTAISTDVVLYSSSYYYVKTGSVTSLNDAPLGSTWNEFDGQFESVATDILLAQDVTIRRKLTMGDASQESNPYGASGIIQSLGGLDISGNVTFNQNDVALRFYKLDYTGIFAISGSIGGFNLNSNRLYSGTGTFNNANTPFYMNSVDNTFSLGNKLSFSSSVLTIEGVINVVGGNASTQEFVNNATSSLSSSVNTTITSVSSSFNNTIGSVSSSFSVTADNLDDRIFTDANGLINKTPNPSGAGLFLGSTFLGYYSGSSWITYMDNQGDFYLTGSNGFLVWDSSTSTLNIRGAIVATTGSIEGDLTVGSNDNGFILSGQDSIFKLVDTIGNDQYDLVKIGKLSSSELDTSTLSQLSDNLFNPTVGTSTTGSSDGLITASVSFGAHGIPSLFFKVQDNLSNTTAISNTTASWSVFNSAPFTVMPNQNTYIDMSYASGVFGSYKFVVDIIRVSDGVSLYTSPVYQKSSIYPESNSLNLNLKHTFSNIVSDTSVRLRIKAWVIGFSGNENETILRIPLVVSSVSVNEGGYIWNYANAVNVSVKIAPNLVRIGNDGMVSYISDNRLLSMTPSRAEFRGDYVQADSAIFGTMNVEVLNAFQLNVGSTSTTLFLDQGQVRMTAEPTVPSVYKNVVVITNNDGILTSSGITTSSLNHLSGVTSNIQDQINTKAPLSRNLTFTVANFLSSSATTQDLNTDRTWNLSIVTASLLGTTNRVNVSGTGKILGSDITLTLPQDIHTDANPTFDTLTLGTTNAEGHLKFNRDGYNYIGTTHANGVLAFVTSGSSYTDADSTLILKTNKEAEFKGDVVLANVATLTTHPVRADRTITINGTTNQVTVTGGTQNFTANRTWTLSLPQDIHTTAQPTFDGGIINVATTRKLHVRNVSSGQSSILHTNSGLLLTAGDMTLTNKYTPSIQFGSTDPSFTSINPKVMAYIVGSANEDYNHNSKTGMNVEVWTTNNSLGSSGFAHTLVATFTATGFLTLNSQATGTTHAVRADRSITINGTANQVNVSAGTQNLTADRTWTLSLPQNINTGATPTFAQITLSNPASTTSHAVRADRTLTFGSTEYVTSSQVSAQNLTADRSWSFALRTGSAIGTANQVIISGTGMVVGNDLTFALPQDIGVSSSVNFGSVTTLGNVIVGGNLAVYGTETIVDVDTVTISDPNITLNLSGSDFTANGAGLHIVRASTFGSIVFDSTKASYWKAGLLGSEVELADISSTQTFTGKTWNSNIIQVLYGGTGLSSVALNHIPYGNGTGALLTSSNLRFDGTVFNVTGSANVDNIRFDGNTISTVSGNLVIDSAGNLDIKDVVLFSGSLKLNSGVGIEFTDTRGIFPTDVNSAFSWVLNNDGARIYAQQPSSDVIDFVFKITDNVDTNDRFIYWIDSHQGAIADAFPLWMDGNRFVVNYLNHYNSTGANNVDFYVLASSSTNLTSALIHADVSQNNVGIGASPNVSYKLDVSGAFRATTSITSALLDIDNIRIDGNTISSTNTNGNIILDANGIGFIDVKDNLVVTGSSRFVQHGIFDTYLSSPTFASGFAGNGWRIRTEGSTYELDIDNLTVRGRMRVYELLINQIRATNGSVFVSSTGKVKTATLLTGVLGQAGSTYGFTTDTDTNHGFLVNDLIRAQRFTGNGLYQLNMTVTNVPNLTTFTASLAQTEAYIDNISKFVDVEFVRLGNTTNTARQGAVYMSADDSGAPFIDIVDGVASFASWNTSDVHKVRLGNLSGIVDADIPVPITGYGLYSENVFLKGTIVANSGNIGGWLMDANRIYKGDVELNSSTQVIKLGQNASMSGNGVFLSGSGEFNLQADSDDYIRLSGANLTLSSNNFALSGSTTLRFNNERLILGANANTQTFASGTGILLSSSGAFRMGTGGSHRLEYNGSTLTLDVASFNLQAGNLYVVGNGASSYIRMGSLTGTDPNTTNVGFYADNDGNLLLKASATVNTNFLRFASGVMTINSTAFDLVVGTTLSVSSTTGGLITLGGTGNTYANSVVAFSGSGVGKFGSINVNGNVGGSIFSGTTNMASVSNGFFISGSGEFNFVRDTNNYMKLSGTTFDLRATTATISGSSVTLGATTFKLVTPNMLLTNEGNGLFTMNGTTYAGAPVAFSGSGIGKFGSINVNGNVGGSIFSGTTNMASTSTGFFISGSGEFNFVRDVNNYMKLSGTTFDLRATTAVISGSSVTLGANTFKLVTPNMLLTNEGNGLLTMNGTTYAGAMVAFSGSGIGKIGSINIDGNTGGRIFSGATTMASTSTGFFVSGSGEFNFVRDVNNYMKLSGTTFDLRATTAVISGSSVTLGATTFKLTTPNMLLTNEGNGLFTMNGTTYAGAMVAFSGSGIGKFGSINIDGNTGGRIFVGTGTFNNTNTGFFLSGSGQFSLKDTFAWDGTNLTISGSTSRIQTPEFFLGGATNYISGSNGTLAIRSQDFVLSASSTLVLNTLKFALGASANTQTISSGDGVFMSASGQFRVGNSTEYIRFGNTPGDLEIQTPNFTVDASGNVEANNLVLDGVSTADIFMYRQLTITTANSSSHYQTVTNPSDGLMYTRLLLHATGSHFVRIVNAPPYPIAYIKLPNVNNTQIVIEPALNEPPPGDIYLRFSALKGTPTGTGSISYNSRERLWYDNYDWAKNLYQDDGSYTNVFTGRNGVRYEFYANEYDLKLQTSTAFDRLQLIDVTATDLFVTNVYATNLFASSSTAFIYANQILASSSIGSAQQNRVAIWNANGVMTWSGITTTELNYLDNVTSDIQSQLNGKVTTGRTLTFNGSNFLTVDTSAQTLASDRTWNLSITTGSILPTNNRVSVSGTGKILGGDITLTLPQDIHTDANPTFDSVNLGNANGLANIDTFQQTSVWYTGLAEQINLGTRPGNYYYYVNLGGLGAGTGIQMATSYGAGDRLYYVRRRSDNASAPNGANVWQPWRRLITAETDGQVYLDTQASATTSAVRADRTITINGTTNQINTTATNQNLTADRTWTLSLPQDIHNSATPTFTRLTLSQATGTAPLTVSSTTVVTNLNADMLDGLHASSFIQDAGGVANEIAFWNTGNSLSGSSQLRWVNNTLSINGTLEATVKSFNIKHPTKENKRLIYGVVEAPEHSVFVRGKIKTNVIELPEEWTGLVDEDTITVQLTPIGNPQKLVVVKIKDNKVYIKNKNWFKKGIDAFYFVQGERKDVPKLIIERDV